jgi:hypothetical protein
MAIASIQGNKSALLTEALVLGSATALLTTSGSPFSYLARALEPRQVFCDADACDAILLHNYN